MKHMKWGHKRFGAIFLSLALLCGMFLGTIGWTLAAAEKDVFSVDFSNLAALVDDDGGIFTDGLYTPAADDEILNDWVLDKFDLKISREGHTYLDRTDLGTPYNNGAGNSYWSVSENGYLVSSEQGGGEPVRTVQTLTLKNEDGELAVLDNFEAKIVFKNTTDTRGYVFVLFNEANPGKFGWRSDWGNVNQDGVFVGMTEHTNHVSDYSGITVKSSGESFSPNCNDGYMYKTKESFATDKKLTAGDSAVDHEMIVRVVGSDVYVKVSTPSTGAVLWEKTYAGAATGGTGAISIGAGRGTRAIKSIEVKELDATGNQVDFGTLSKQGLPEKFEADFRELAGLVEDTDYTDDLYTPAETDADLDAWMLEKFGMTYNREGHTFTNRAHLGTVIDTQYGHGNTYWLIDKNGYLQKNGTANAGEMYRDMELLTVKGSDGEYAVLDNFEARIVFKNTTNDRGAVGVFFNEQEPGKMAFNSAHADYLKQDAVLVGVVSDAAPNGGITVKGSGENLENCIYDMKEDFAASAPMTSGAAAVDHEMIVKVIGSDVYVKVTTPSTGAVLWEKTYAGAVKGATGTVSIGAGKGSRAIKSIKIKELDAQGNWVDFGTSLLEPVNPNDTVRYTYNSDADLDAFTSYFMPVPGVDADAVRTEGTENDNWYVKNGAMLYKTNSLYKGEDDIQAVNGNVWNSNMAIAMLETQKYENFILDVDFYVSGRWAVFGFGAKGGTDGAFSSQKNGGYTVHIEAGAGRGEIKLTGWDPTAGQSKMLSNIFVSPYSGSGKHHMRLIVKQGVVTVYLDDVAPVTFTLPTSYESGYVYLGSNNEVTYFDNLTVLDLDKGPFEITSIKSGLLDTVVINRDQGDMMDLDAMPSFVTGYDANGYAYTFPAKWLNSDYRSYKDGSFDFKLVPGLAEFEIADSLNATKKVTNNINNAFDTDTTVKYYFDHENDLLDFVTGYDDTSKGGHSTTDDNKYVIASSPLERWKLTGNGAVTNNYKSVGYGHNGTTMGWDVSTLVQKELNLTNFRLELDFTHGENFWYPYVITGMQDFTAYRGEKGGTYFFMEYEGRPNIGNGLRDWSSRKYTAPITAGNTFFNQYDAGMSTKHHLIIEVVDGILTFQVDNSDKFPNYLANTALGGYFGIAGMGNGTTFANITITALDDGGNAVPLATADRSMATKAEEYVDTFVSGKAYTGTWKFAWNDKYVFEF